MIHSDYCFKELHRTKSKKFEILCVQIENPNNLENLSIALVYRPPSLNNQIDNDQFLDSFYELIDTSRNFVVVGDFNYSFTGVCANDKFANSFLSMSDSMGLVLKKTPPTRGHNNLDLLLTNCDNISNTLIRAPFSSSDHSTVFFDVRFLPVDTLRIPTYQFFRADFTVINQTLSNINWNSVFDDCNTVDEMYNCFVDELQSVIAAHVPFEVNIENTTKFPQYIQNIVHKKNRIFKLFTIYRSDYLANEYRHCVREIEKHICKFKSYLEKKYFIRKNKKTFHQKFSRKNANNQRLRITDPISGETEFDEFKQCELLASQFNSVFTVDNGLLPPLEQRDYGTQHPFTFFPHEIMKYMKCLKNSASVTEDKLPQIFLKRCAQSIVTPLCHIFNISMIRGEVPNAWKRSVVVPVPKKSDSTKPVDYRPISLNSAVSKIMEKRVRDFLYKFFDQHSIIPYEQFGFLRCKSVEQQLLDSRNIVMQAIHSGDCVDTVYFDFSKAFDRVSHSKLLHKMTRFGFPGWLVDWTKDWLSNRYFRVRVRNTHSNWYEVESGVPQGSVLGPLLFLIYVAEIPTILSHHMITTRMFADDIKVFCRYSFAEFNNGHKAMSNAISRLHEWSLLWQFDIAVEKSCCVYYGHNNQKNPYMLNNSILPQNVHMRDLGVIMQANNHFNLNVDNTVAKSLKAWFACLRTLCSHNKDMLLLVYKTYVLPILEFASSVWSPHLQKDIKKIERVQAIVTRIIIMRCYPDLRNDVPSYLERLKILGLKTLHKRRIIKDLILFYSIFNMNSALIFSKFYVWRPTNGRRSSFSLNVPHSKYNVFINSYFVRTAKWVSLLPSMSLRLPTAKSFAKFLNTVNIYDKLSIEMPTL